MKVETAMADKKTEVASSTTCYTYEVLMVVQVLAEDKDKADEKLDREGGYVSKRTVILRDAVPLYDGNASK